MRGDPVKGGDEDNVEDDGNDYEADANDDEDNVNNDVPRYERRRSHVLREKKRHGETKHPSLSCNLYFRLTRMILAL